MHTGAQLYAEYSSRMNEINAWARSNAGCQVLTLKRYHTVRKITISFLMCASFFLQLIIYIVFITLSSCRMHLHVLSVSESMHFYNVLALAMLSNL